AMTAAAIRVLVVDDHPAVRQGIEAMLGHEDGIVCIGTAASAGEAHELWPAAERLPADVVVVDRHLPDEDGLSLCLWLRTRTPAPAVVIYSAFADGPSCCRRSSPGPARSSARFRIRPTSERRSAPRPAASAASRAPRPRSAP